MAALGLTSAAPLSGLRRCDLGDDVDDVVDGPDTQPVAAAARRDMALAVRSRTRRSATQSGQLGNRAQPPPTWPGQAG